MPDQTVLTVIDRGCAVVRINRPEKLNALNAGVLAGLRETFERLKADPEVRAVVLTGSGEKAFVAGADIGELSQLNEGTGRRFAEEGQGIFRLVEELGKPVIAAVNGYALGGGCELALACHIRIASENAKFGQPEVNLGIIPGYGGTQRLARLVGRGKATEMILTGEPVNAQEALRIGLVNKVVPAAELMAAADTMARAIMSKAPQAVSRALKALLETDERSLTDGQSVEAALFGQCCATEDFAEGTKAFLGKRPPIFKNH